MSDLKLTKEQEAIRGSKAQVIKVTAYAGTGKTSTLRVYSEANPNDRILYVAFNKAIQMEASGKFPAHVTCKTAHSIAYGICGREYGNVPNKLQGDMKPFHIQRFLARSLNHIPAAAHNLYGGRVIETIKKYLVSADAEMSLHHVSIGNAPVEVKNFDARQILADAKNIWGQMQDLKTEVPMLHDGYLKLYQISGRRLPYGIILLDEAQDTNPVTQAIVDAQQARKVYVGDRHQAIYGFRGATNAMEMIKADEHHYLTGSFRFGEAVAEVANMILDVKGEDVQLRGLGPAAGESQVRPIGANEGYAFISRGNVALFNRAVQCLSKEEPFSFVGDIKGYRFDQILDVFNLSTGQQVKDPFIRSFAGFDELAEYAEAINDREVKSRCKVVTKYGADIPRLIEQIDKKALPPVLSGDETGINDRRIILTTGHKSKGLEFPNVRLAGDFMELLDEEGKVFDISKASVEEIEEINIQYVAATRAQKALHLCEPLEDYLEHLKEVEARHRPTA
ncbi:UvrD-helicase domain-containing protein [Chromobacterium haemolyticum]|uniref:UvrD-helicase domain-containing protein n=1 Tax=Chromobacterium haemolyticum TaxID=394935 RepID=UPI00244D2302|nr:UvrD-helicase domain-containing protein [Chromobacterium haemolyticum]MDH0342030.1 UvrD-helicase domain-containing protein [Chromobacterium haemolyticum]